MKNTALFSLILLFFFSCNYIENSKKERQRNDSISHARIEFIKDSTSMADSLKHINDSIKKVKAYVVRINSIKSSIRITSCYLSEPNSAGGCDAHFYYVNKSKKTIKYVVFDASFKNNVGDFVTCDISNDASFRGQDTGPVKTGKSSGGVWDCAIYNWSATKLVINSVDIDYMDGTKITIKGNDLLLIGLKEKQLKN